MVRAYIRGNGQDWGPNDELDAVVVTASAHMVSNPSGGLIQDTTAGPFTQSLRGAFQGWILAELAVPNRYCRRAY
jgi:hypothetical protein